MPIKNYTTDVQASRSAGEQLMQHPERLALPGHRVIEGEVVE